MSISMEKAYIYALTHDTGFAPNPFYHTCTLACCKVKIRLGAFYKIIEEVRARYLYKNHFTHWSSKRDGKLDITWLHDKENLKKTGIKSIDDLNIWVVPHLRHEFSNEATHRIGKR
jgi:hypothetical protein